MQPIHEGFPLIAYFENCVYHPRERHLGESPRLGNCSPRSLPASFWQRLEICLWRKDDVLRRRGRSRFIFKAIHDSLRILYGADPRRPSKLTESLSHFPIEQTSFAADFQILDWDLNAAGVLGLKEQLATELTLDHFIPQKTEYAPSVFDFIFYSPIAPGWRGSTALGSKGLDRLESMQRVNMGAGWAWKPV